MAYVLWHFRNVIIIIYLLAGHANCNPGRSPQLDYRGIHFCNSHTHTPAVTWFHLKIIVSISTVLLAHGGDLF